MADLGPITCAGCGLLCDDVTVESADHAPRLEPPCPVGTQWFSERLGRTADAPAATIDGEPSALEAAVTRAAELLRSARRPLLAGFESATVEDARAAVALADRLGGLLSAGDVGQEWSGAPAVPLRGASTATLGEIRDRSQLVVIWREDPETTHPRLLERLALDGGKPPERTLVVIDERATDTARRADAHLSWGPERDLEALTSLHMLQRGLTPRSSGLKDELRGLSERIRAVPHLAFAYGAGLSAGAGGQRRVLALHELVRALCQERHALTLELPRAPGTKGAEDVLAWQSGYSGRVDFAGGHPEWVTAPEPADDVDVTVRVESGPAGTIVAGPDADVWIRTAAVGVEASGTMHRLDGVPVALQAPLPGNTPTAAAVLRELLAELGS